MSEAPERIWAKPGMPGYITDGPCDLYDVEYVRADMLHEIFLRYSKAETRRIEELEERLKAAGEDANEAETYAAEMEDKLKEMAEMDDKLAKVVTRMQHIAVNKTTDELTRIEWDTHDTFAVLDACILSARATLAELKRRDR